MDVVVWLSASPVISGFEFHFCPGRIRLGAPAAERVNRRVKQEELCYYPAGFCCCVCSLTSRHVIEWLMEVCLLRGCSGIVSRKKWSPTCVDGSLAPHLCWSVVDNGFCVIQMTKTGADATKNLNPPPPWSSYLILASQRGFPFALYAIMRWMMMNLGVSNSGSPQEEFGNLTFSAAALINFSWTKLLNAPLKV